jgi:hypothetical protein
VTMGLGLESLHLEFLTLFYSSIQLVKARVKA